MVAAAASTPANNSPVSREGTATRMRLMGSTYCVTVSAPKGYGAAGGVSDACRTVCGEVPAGRVARS